MMIEEINRYIHEQILGNCLHKGGVWKDVPWVGKDGHKIPSGYRCTKCGSMKPGVNIPDYCSDDSPRRLLNEVVAKVITETDEPFITELETAMLKASPHKWTCSTDYVIVTAEQIARACVEAHKSEGDSNEG